MPSSALHYSTILDPSYFTDCLTSQQALPGGQNGPADGAEEEGLGKIQLLK